MDIRFLNPAAGSLAALKLRDAVMSTGYKDEDLLSSNAENTKYNFAVHFRPDDQTEMSISFS